MIPGKKVVVSDARESRKRSWRERLFSRPWRPLKAWDTKFLIPDGQVIHFNDTLVMNSRTKAELMLAIEAQK